MDALYRDLEARGLSLLLVNIGERPEVVRKAVKERGYTAPVLLDGDREVSATYAVTATPTVWLIDRRSRIVGRAVGRREWASDLGRRTLEALLQADVWRDPARGESAPRR